MKKKSLIFLSALAVLALAGCEAKKTEPEVPTVVDVKETEAEQLEKKYAEGSFEEADYHRLAELCGEDGQRRKERQLLEECYQKFQTPETLEKLSSVTVNIEEESGKAAEMTEQLYQNISTEEFRNETAAVLGDESWFSTMGPRISQGMRRYYREGAEGQGSLFIAVGYDENGRRLSEVWYTDLEGQVIYVSQTSKYVQMITTQVQDGSYGGSFDSWLCLASTGDVYHETGTLENGVFSGEYQADVHFGEQEMDLFSLWNGRGELDFTTYTGTFDAEGKTTVEQPEASKMKASKSVDGAESYLVYAWSENKKNYLSVGIMEGEDETKIFGLSTLGLSDYPSYEPYEPKAEETVSDAENQIQVRVYDSRLEWFDGTSWVTLGNVEDYLAEDPFAEYSVNTGGTEEDTQEGTEEEVSDHYSQRGAGSVAEKKASKPQTTSKPAQTTTPTTDTGSSSSGGGSSSGGSSSGGSSSGGSSSSGGGSSDSGSSGGGSSTPEPTPEPTPDPAPDAGGSSEGDTDIEWSPDVM